MTRSKRSNLTVKVASVLGISTFTVLAGLPSLAQMNRSNDVAPNAPTEMNNRGGNRSMSPADVSALEREFIVMAAQGNNAEIQMSRLALERANDENVRQYAQMMIEQHTMANQNLQPIAAEQGIDLPTTASSFDTAVLETLSQVPDEQFDQAYMNAQVNAHLKSAGVFRTGAQQVEDADLRSYAARILPAVQQHLEMASQMAGNTSAQRMQ